MSTPNTPATASPSVGAPAETDMGAIFEAARAVHEPAIHQLHAGTDREASVLVIPNGMNAVNVKPFLDAFRKLPERITGTSHHYTLESLIAHAKEFKWPNSVAWATAEVTPATAQSPAALSASLLVVYDHHVGESAFKAMPPASEDEMRSHARWCQFGALYQFPISTEFAAWRAMCGKDLSQEVMSAFLEDHLHEVCDSTDAGERATKLAETLGVGIASASTLLGFARKSAATVNLFVSEKRDSITGAVELIYQEEVEHQTKDREKVTPPGVFAIRVPVLLGGTEYRLAVRLRSKVTGRAVKWSFEVFRIDNAFTLAVQEEVVKFRDATGLPVYQGKLSTK